MFPVVGGRFDARAIEATACSHRCPSTQARSIRRPSLLATVEKQPGRGVGGHSHRCPARRERRVTYGRCGFLGPFLFEADDLHPPGEGSDRCGQQGTAHSRQSVDLSRIMPSGHVFGPRVQSSV
jgi:hypothetical protein